ncbi:6534_t:CDS:2 [Ambispora gerdemannii]|uniref:6534_t:CDS:1 n=1 Tax=Ambispora gerdemannii TaxID=144530 RepID=A0A9N9CIR6_9GLOM|nr:6534_t:CDS:2 [Ambispora gerdemannii]
MSVDNVVKVANISALVTEPILRQLFEYLGEVINLKLHNSPHGDGVQECIVEFKDTSSAITALHLTGVELGDRTLMVSSTTAPAGINDYTNPFQQQIPPLLTAITPPRPPPSMKQIQSIPPKPMAAVVSAASIQPISASSLAVIRANPAISPTVAQFDPAKAEEISRTVYIGNINSSISEPELTQFFSACGPVAYVKMAGDPAQPTRFAFLEFATYEGAQAAMQMNGVMLGERPLKVNHSKNAINKTPKKNDAPDVQATMRRVREAQARIQSRLSTSETTQPDDSPNGSAPLEDIVMEDASPVPDVKTRRRSSSRSIKQNGSKSRSRSISRVRRRRSRSRDRDLALDYHYRHRRSRSRSKDRFRGA